MPNKKSAIKSLRQDQKKHISNISVISEIRTITKKVRAAIEAKDLEKSNELLKKLESKLDKAAKTKRIKKQTSSRKISRLKKQFAKIQKNTEKN